jgi:UDP-N-acetylglucosamine:LPS N-acetylglucosamine transferase
MWLYGRIAHFIFPEPQAYEFALDMGVPPSRISMISNVFASEAAAVPAMDEAREGLKIHPRFTVLLSFGSSGFGRQGKEFLRLLRMRDSVTQVVITPGRKRKSLAAARAYADESTFVAQGWVPLMPYMAAADLVIGKAGWLTLTDASAIGRPTLILDYIKGQEDENVRVACLSGAARHVTPAQAVECVLRYSRDETALSRDFPATRSISQSVERDRERLTETVRRVITANTA